MKNTSSNNDTNEISNEISKENVNNNDIVLQKKQQ